MDHNTVEQQIEGNNIGWRATSTLEEGAKIKGFGHKRVKRNEKIITPDDFLFYVNRSSPSDEEWLLFFEKF